MLAPKLTAVLLPVVILYVVILLHFLSRRLRLWRVEAGIVSQGSDLSLISIALDITALLQQISLGPSLRVSVFLAAALLLFHLQTYVFLIFLRRRVSDEERYPFARGGMNVFFLGVFALFTNGVTVNSLINLGLR